MVHARWEIRENQWVFTIKADRFLRNMVRAIVGSLWEVGSGKMNLKEFSALIQQKDRSFAGVSAPAKALFLHTIEYPSTLFIHV